MPANATGPWRAFSEADPKTWPESGDRYLVWAEVGYAVTAYFFHGGIWGFNGVTHWASILPPGESPSKEEGK